MQFSSYMQKALLQRENLQPEKWYWLVCLQQFLQVDARFVS